MVIDPLVRAEIDNLYADYVTAVDEGPLAAWPDLFTADASYVVVPRGNHERGLPLALMRCEGRGMLVDRVYAIERANFHVGRRVRHVLGPLRVRAVDGCEQGWSVDGTFTVLECLTGELPHVLAFGTFHDVVVREADGRPRFAERRVVNDVDLVPNSLVYPL